MERLIYRILAFWLLPLCSMAQNPPSKEIDLEDFIERLFAVQDLDLDYEGIYEVLFQLYQNPIDINRATAEAFQATYLLSPIQINSLLEHRERFGPFLSLYELQAVPEFDLQTIETLLPFVTIATNLQVEKSLKERYLSANQAYVILRQRRVWETRRGFTPPDTSSTGRISSRYLGDPNELYLRMRVQKTRDFSFGFTLDKDAGEPFVWDPKTSRYGFNFLSVHLTKYELGKLKVVTLGDFQASFGQGLIFGAGYGLGKGAETVPTVRRSSVGILPYTAALEFGFFRGAAMTYRIRANLEATVLGSSVKRNARIQAALDSLESDIESFSSINQSGLHRTPSEISTKNTLQENSLGTNIQWKKKQLSIGGNVLYTKFDKAWERQSRVYSQFEFGGSKNLVSSLYFNYNLKNSFIFGESAISSSGGTGTVLGIISSLSKVLSISLLWRHYDRNFHSFYANGFSEGTRPINERGIYLGLEYAPSRRWKWNAYYDFFKFPWLRFRAYAPSSGYEWLSRITFRPQRSLIVFAQIRQEQKDRNLTDTNEPQLGYQLAPLRKINALLSLEYQVSQDIFIRSRVLWRQVNFNQSRSNGFMILQDVRLQKRNWRITGRVALFDTDDFDNRQYAFENNVLWAFSIPAFSGQGIRYYLLGQYQISERLTGYLRFARTSFTDRDEIGSGLQTIEGNTQTESTFLLRYNLVK
ncbi:ComEA family DNA-binding protein [Algoriphagus namhaensis]